MLLLLLAGCSRETAPQVDPLEYLRVGVEPEAEADALERHFVQRGARVDARVGGSGFRALSFEGPGDATAVRVITEQGVAAALDAPQRPEVSTVSLATDVPNGRDLDGDGRPEIVVAVRAPGAPRACLGLLRVLRDGAIREVGLDPGEALPGTCVERLRDVGGAPGPEALVVERYDRTWTGSPGEVRLPLVGRSGRWGPALASAYDEFWKDAVTRREERLERSKPREEPSRVLMLAVELAAIARLRQQDVVVQVRAFDDALEGIVLPESHAEVADCLRSHVVAGWPSPVPACYTPDLHGP